MFAKNSPLRIFGISLIVSIVALIAGFLYGGWQAFVLVLILGLFETSLSFDNAVINSRILEKMSHKWRTAFLTVGIVIAVFGMRIFFPLVIVGATTGLSPLGAWNLAMEKGDPSVEGTYGYILHEAHPQIAAFGGMFLLMLFLGFIFEEREIKWLSWLEKPLAKLGNLDYADVIVGLGALLVVANLADKEHFSVVMTSGVAGMMTYIVVNALGNFFEGRLEASEEAEEQKVVSGLVSGSGVSQTVLLTGKAGFMSFLYLEVIDASFSFDGVIGAFAITTDPVIIALGLGLIGAMFVRSITIFLVNKGTLNDYVYLDHGAHWAIGALAVLLIVSIATPVPELVTGLLGIVLIVSALIASIRRNKREASLALSAPVVV